MEKTGEKMKAIGVKDIDFQRVVDFHGHGCMGLAIGFRAAKAALNHLGDQRAGDEELVAIVETDGCGIDAIQVLLGCTIGKGNLIFKDYGKNVYTVAKRSDTEAVRIALRPGVFQRTSGQQNLMEKVFSGRASDKDLEAFWKMQEQGIKQILSIEEDVLFKIEEVKVELPEKARIFRSVTCEFCGEDVMEPRARIRQGRPACIPCAERYSRGWDKE